MNIRRHAVLTGDVVASSGLKSTERQRLPVTLKTAAAEVRQAFPFADASELAVFRGDAWQMVVSQPTLSLRAAVFFRAGVIAASPRGTRLDTRLAIAIGDVDFVPKERVSEGDGQAFRNSGNALDAMTDPLRMKLIGPDGNEPVAVIIELVDALIQQWTARQAQSVKGRILGRTQKDIAEAWPGGITQQTVARHLAKAHWPAIERALSEIENILKAL